MNFLISERYRLELHWSAAEYVEEGLAMLKDCYFSGPVLNQIIEMQPEDSIRLDFAYQYYIFIEYFYIAELSWKGIQRAESKIFLNDVVLKNKYLNFIPKLKNDDYVVIDTKKHEDEEHLYNLVYTSYLVKKDGTFYDFRSMK